MPVPGRRQLPARTPRRDLSGDRPPYGRRSPMRISRPPQRSSLSSPNAFLYAASRSCAPFPQPHARPPSPPGPQHPAHGRIGLRLEGGVDHGIVHRPEPAQIVGILHQFRSQDQSVAYDRELGDISLDPPTGGRTSTCCPDRSRWRPRPSTPRRRPGPRPGRWAERGSSRPPACTPGPVRGQWVLSAAELGFLASLLQDNPRRRSVGPPTAPPDRGTEVQ